MHLVFVPCLRANLLRPNGSGKPDVLYFVEDIVFVRRRRRRRRADRAH